MKNVNISHLSISALFSNSFRVEVIKSIVGNGNEESWGEEIGIRKEKEREKKERNIILNEKQTERKHQRKNPCKDIDKDWVLPKERKNIQSIIKTTHNVGSGC